MNEKTTTSPILEVNNLRVNYGAIQALKGVSLQIQKGTIVSLVGSNGAGKSTLIKSILGIQPVASGEIRYRSTTLVGLAPSKIIKKGISLSPEGRQVFADLTVYENLRLGAYSTSQSRSQLEDSIEEIYLLFPILQKRSSQQAGALSGGEQQMLAIGRALMMKPELLLLDEPSLGISPLLTEKIFEVLVNLNKKGTTIFLAEQNASLALAISHWGYVLETGEVSYQDSAANLLVNDVVRKSYLGV